MAIVTLDHSGRVVIPQSLREQLGLHPDSQLNVEIQDGQLILKPFSIDQHPRIAPGVPRVYRKGTALVVESQPMGDLEAAVEALRDERMDHCWVGDEGSF